MSTTLSDPATSRPAALVALSLAVLMPSLDTSIANVALPAIARTFDASFAQVQWVVLAYLLTLTTVVVGVGRLGDLVGRRRLLLAGVGLFTSAAAASGLAPDLQVMLAARAAQGLGAAVMTAMAMTFVGEAAPPSRTGAVMGWLGTMSAVGTSLGPVLGGLLTAGPGWRAVFLVDLPLGAACLALTLAALPPDRRRKGAARGFDGLGAILLGLTLAAWGLGMTAGRGATASFDPGLLAAASLGAVLFVAWQAHAASPLIDLKVFMDPVRGPGLAGGIATAGAVMATLVVGPFYLSLGLGLEPAAVGLTLSAGPMAAAVTGAPCGRLVDRFGPRRTAIAGMAAMAGGLLLLVAAVPLGVAGYVGGIVVVTSGYALFQAANSTAVMAGAGSAERGVVSAMLGLSRNLGLITGAAALGAVYAAVSGGAGADAASAAAGLRATMVIAAILVGLALAFIAWRGRGPAVRP